MTPLEDQLNRLSERGTRRPVDELISALRAELINDVEPRKISNHREAEVLSETSDPQPRVNRQGPRLAFAAAAIVVAGILGTIAYNAAGEGTNPDDAAASMPAPDATLPPGGSSAVTLFGSGPDYSYRLSDDAEIGWASDGVNEVRFCWHTPVIEDCGSEPVPGTPPIAIPVAAGQTLTIVPANVDYTLPTTAVLVLHDGTTIEEPIAWSTDPITIGYARFDTPIDQVSETSTTG